MDGEAPIRIAARILLVVGGAVGGTFRRRAARSGENLWSQRRREGIGRLALRGVAGILSFGALVAYLIDPHLMAWSAVALPSWERWLGAVAGAAGVPLLYWVLRSLGGNLTDTVAIRHDHSLVTAGPYRWVRHPFYVVASLQLAAMAVLLANWLPALGLLFFWVYLWWRTPLEEAKLIERFGDEYRRYMARTGRFWPRFARSS